MKYLLDANTFIEANNRYYGMEICPAYWDWLLLSHSVGDIFSIEFVKSELANYGDDVSDWVKEHSDFFLAESDVDTQNAFMQVVAYVDGLAGVKQAAKAEFLAGADPWLIAKARVTGTTIVTHEQLNLAATRKIFIPNICQHFGVAWMNTFEMLSDLEARFVLPAA